MVEINGVAVAAVPDEARRAAMRTSPLKLKVDRAGAARDVVVVFP